MQDVVIVGGSSAGLSAALVLGRSLRAVTVVDSGQPCNRFSHASHGFLTRDGVAPAELVRIAREQLARYETVQFCDDTVTRVTVSESGFVVTTASGVTIPARKVLLAYGLRDHMPPLPGIDQFWGRSAFHCPYCDGWEVHNQPIMVYNDTPTAMHQVMLLRNWTLDLTLCTGGTLELSAEDRKRLVRHNIRLIEQPVARLEGEDGQIRQVVFADGEVLPLRAMFIRPRNEHSAPFARDLGCTINEQNVVQVDVLGRTSVPGVYAAGDIATPMRSVAVAVAGGSSAGAGINFDLVSQDFA